MINCTECDFYCDNEKNFEAHKQLIHPKKNGIRCRICGEFFESKRDLMYHRKAEHIRTVANCEKNIKGECMFSSKTCFWNHEVQPENMRKSEQNFKCYT